MACWAAGARNPDASNSTGALPPAFCPALVTGPPAGVEVQTDSHCLRADAAVVTVPLGVLKAADGLRFSPPLPARKRGAIKRIGFGSMNKVGWRTVCFPCAVSLGAGVRAELAAHRMCSCWL